MDRDKHAGWVAVSTTWPAVARSLVTMASLALALTAVSVTQAAGRSHHSAARGAAGRWYRVYISVQGDSLASNPVEDIREDNNDPTVGTADLLGDSTHRLSEWTGTSRSPVLVRRDAAGYAIFSAGFDHATINTGSVHLGRYDTNTGQACTRTDAGSLLHPLRAVSATITGGYGTLVVDANALYGSFPTLQYPITTTIVCTNGNGNQQFTSDCGTWCFVLGSTKDAQTLLDPFGRNNSDFASDYQHGVRMPKRALGARFRYSLPPLNITIHNDDGARPGDGDDNGDTESLRVVYSLRFIPCPNHGLDKRHC